MSPSLSTPPPAAAHVDAAGLPSEKRFNGARPSPSLANDVARRAMSSPPPSPASRPGSSRNTTIAPSPSTPPRLSALLPGVFAGSSPYESPYIPPPTPTPPEQSSAGFSNDDTASIGLLAADENVADNPSNVTPFATSPTPDSFTTPSSDLDAFPLPTLAFQPALFDQRSLDLTTISEERSSLTSQSTQSFSVATSGGTWGSSRGLVREVTRDSTLSGEWEMLEAEVAGSRATVLSDVSRLSTNDTVKSLKRSLPPAEAEHPLSSSLSSPHGFSEAEQVLIRQGDYVARPTPLRSSSSTAPTIPALPSDSILPPTPRSPLRPARSAQRPLSSSGVQRPSLDVTPPSNSAMLRRRPSSTGSAKDLPALVSSPLPPSNLGFGPPKQPIQEDPARLSATTASPSSNPCAPSSTLTELVASSLFAQAASTLKKTADELAQHGDAVRSTATEARRRLAIVDRALAVDDDDAQGPDDMLEAALALYEAGSTLLERALTLGRRALERAKDEQRRTRSDLEHEMTAQAKRIDIERWALQLERDAFEREKKEWEAGRGAGPRIVPTDSKADPSTDSLNTSSVTPSEGTTSMAAAVQQSSLPRSTASPQIRASSPSTSPWKIFGSTSSVKSKHRLSLSESQVAAASLLQPSGEASQGGVLGRKGSASPRRWGLKRRGKQSSE